MKKQFILCCITLIVVAPICLGQQSPGKSSPKPGPNESAIRDLEKSAWEAYKNKQADAFKALMSKDYYGVYSEGVKNLDGEIADMAKTDLRDYSFADVKVLFPNPKVAVVTYKATVQATHGGADISGTYNIGSVWLQEGKNGSAPFTLKQRGSKSATFAKATAGQECRKAEISDSTVELLCTFQGD